MAISFIGQLTYSEKRAGPAVQDGEAVHDHINIT